MTEARPITVAIPTCNGERYVAEALRSIWDQRDVEFDLLVCDDRSTDQTLEIVRRFAGDWARFAMNETRLGLAGNWNRCVELAWTPLVAIVHQDDVLLPGHLAAHRKRLDANPALGMTVSGSAPIDAAGRPIDDGSIDPGWIGPKDRDYGPGAFVREIAGRLPVRCSAVVMRRSAHQALGGFNPRFRYAVDWDFWLRMSRAWGVGWIARRTARFRWHAESETHRFRRGLLDLMEIEAIQESIRREDEGLHVDRYELERWSSRLLGRGYFSRAYHAVKAGRPALARRAWRRAKRHWPDLERAAWRSDPKLALAMNLLDSAPGFVRRRVATMILRDRPRDGTAAEG